jgi:hypothetical protein
VCLHNAAEEHAEFELSEDEQGEATLLVLKWYQTTQIIAQQLSSTAHEQNQRIQSKDNVYDNQQLFVVPKCSDDRIHAHRVILRLWFPNSTVFDNQQDSDIILKCGDYKIYARRVLLRLWSPCFTRDLTS